MKKQIIALLALASLGLMLGCNLFGDDEDSTPTTPSVTSPNVSITEASSGTWSSTGTAFTTISKDTFGYCKSDTEYVTEIDADTTTLLYSLNGNTVTVTERDTSIEYSWNGNTYSLDTTIMQTIYILIRQGSGSGLQGTWISSAAPTTTYIKGTADENDIDDLFENPSTFSMQVVFNADNTYQMSMTLTLNQSIASYVSLMTLQDISDESSDIYTSSINGNTITIRANGVANPLTITVGGANFENLILTANYKTLSGTAYMNPSSKAECGTENIYEEILESFMIDAADANQITAKIKSSKPSLFKRHAQF